LSPVTKIGAACIEVGAQKDANLEVIGRYVEQAAQDGIQLLAFGECALQGYPIGLGGSDLDEYDRQRRDAEPVPGPATAVLIELAQRYELELIVGMTELPTDQGSAGLLYNCVVHVTPEGVKAKYRKVHTGGVEACLWSRGDRWVTADSVAGKLGFLICYDLVFPEAARALAVEGAELLVLCTAWTSNHIREGYELFTRSRSLENQVFLMSANLAGGPEGPGRYYGHSRIVDPRGQIIAETKGPGIATAEVDIGEQVRQARARGWWGLTHLANREPASYSALSRKSTG
jgi:N-carbamoylputrescine amidase